VWDGSLVIGYQLEIEALTQKASEVRVQIQDSRNNQADVKRWMRLIRECSSIDRLDRAMINQLVDQVSVNTAPPLDILER